MLGGQTVRAYYVLAKPGIVYGNAIAAVAGFFFGAAGTVNWLSFVSMLIGVSAVMGSACAYNNVLDRNMDSKMQRTKKRSVPSGTISIRNALIFASALLVIGTLLLLAGTNLLTTLIALFGHFAYVVVYGYAKRTTVHGTLVGTISGSTPPVIGYVAATNQLDLTAFILFLILVAWQMPHFYAIGIFRKDDYKAAGVPVLPVVKGMDATRKQMIAYVLLFIASCLSLGVYGGASLLWTLIMSLVGLYWLYLCLDPSYEVDVTKWARKQFGWSLTVLLLLSVLLSIDPLIH